MCVAVAVAVVVVVVVLGVFTGLLVYWFTVMVTNSLASKLYSDTTTTWSHNGPH